MPELPRRRHLARGARRRRVPRDRARGLPRVRAPRASARSEWSEFSRRLTYVAATRAAPRRWPAPSTRAEASSAASTRLLHYLSVPPAAAADVIEMLGAAGLAERARVIMEKPFGTDLESARELERDGPRGLRRGAGLPHRPLPRQGGGAEHPRAALRQRPLRADLEPQPHRPHPDRRAGDARGRLARRPSTRRRAPTATWSSPTCSRSSRFVAMEPPTALAPGAITEEKNKVFRIAAAARSRRRSCAASTRATAPSRASTADSSTETFVALRCEIDNWRWSGVPFYLRTGKRMAESARIISIAFREPPQSMFPGRLAASAATGPTTSPSTSTSPRASRSPSTASARGRAWRSTR